MANKSKSITFPFEGKGSVGGTVMLIKEEGLKGRHSWHEPSQVALLGTDKPQNIGRQVVKTDVNGAIVVLPSYANAATLLGLIFDNAGGTYTPMDTPTASQSIAVVLDRKDVVQTYAACWCDKLTLSGKENEPIEWRLDLLGTTEANSGSVAYTAAPDVMLMSDLTVALNSNNYFPTSFELEFAYNFESRFHNSVTRSSVTRKIPTCLLKLTFDQNSDWWTDVMNLAGTDTAISNAVLTFANGSNTLTWTLPSVTNVSEAKGVDFAGGDSAAQPTVELRAWSSNGTADIMSAVYA